MIHYTTNPAELPHNPVLARAPTLFHVVRVYVTVVRSAFLNPFLGPDSPERGIPYPFAAASLAYFTMFDRKLDIVRSVTTLLFLRYRLHSSWVPAGMSAPGSTSGWPNVLSLGRSSVVLGYRQAASNKTLLSDALRCKPSPTACCEVTPTCRTECVEFLEWTLAATEISFVSTALWTFRTFFFTAYFLSCGALLIFAGTFFFSFTAFHLFSGLFIFFGTLVFWFNCLHHFLHLPRLLLLFRFRSPWSPEWRRISAAPDQITLRQTWWTSNRLECQFVTNFRSRMFAIRSSLKFDTAALTFASSSFLDFFFLNPIPDFTCSESAILLVLLFEIPTSPPP